MATQTDYKTSELGMIPQDWDVVELGKVCDIDTENLTSNTDSDYEFDYISLEQIDNGHLLNTEKYKFKDAPSRARRVVRKNDVLISTVRPNLMSHYYVKNEVRDLICSTGFSVVRGTNKLNMPYLYHHLFANIINSQINLVVVGSNYPAINSHDIKNLKIPLPSTPEQTAIATALSDTDALISSLQTLIAKKKAIKLSAMQNLLSGKIRLPEFAQRPDGSLKTTRQTELGCVPEDWEVVELGEIGYFQSGVGFPLYLQGKKDGEYPVFKVSDLNNIGNEKFMSLSNNYIDEDERKNIAGKIIPENAIIFAKIGAAIFLERKRINKYKSFIDNNMMAFIPCSNLSAEFLYFCFLQIKLGDMVEITALPALSSSRLKLFKIAIPKSTTEQTAIAQLLSDMDAEIESLEGRLKKTQSLKQGMMQALLTGKIRLPLE